jgi:shikimate dehydrogenase
MSRFLPQLTGSFSTPAGTNPTVAVMEAGYVARGLNVRYINCEVSEENLPDAIAGAVAMGWLGFNCSLPHKEAVIAHLDELAPSAQLIGAVNTVVISDGRLVGENTDGQGFVESLKTVQDPSGANAVIFGAGGAAKAIAVELALAGAHTITIVNRSVDKGVALATLVDSHTDTAGSFTPWTQGFVLPPDTSLVVNATSLGFAPQHNDTLDVDYTSFTPGMVVADVVPNPPMTTWLRAAENAGCVTLTGLGMLVNQARVNGALWTGENLDGDVMHRALSEALDISPHN